MAHSSGSKLLSPAKITVELNVKKSDVIEKKKLCGIES